jgi:hypothetical protein
MWFDHPAGKRIELGRVTEALATTAATIATGCPFCRTVLTDALAAHHDTTAEVIDVAQYLLRGIHHGAPPPPELSVTAAVAPEAPWTSPSS